MRVMNRSIFAILILMFGALAPHAPAQWTQVRPGIEYRQFSEPGPVNVFVARMELAETSAIIESTIANGAISGLNTQTVTGMATRADDAVSRWGDGGNPSMGQYRNDVAVAINGDFYSLGSGDPTQVPQSGQIHGGSYDKRFSNFGGTSGFLFKLNRQIGMGGCINHQANRQIVSFPRTGNSAEFSGINVPRGSGALVVYTPQYAARTGTDNSGVEMVVALAEPFLIKPTPAFVSGTVVEVRDLQGNSVIPFDHVVISATGSARTTLLANLIEGDEVRFSQEIRNLTLDCSTNDNSVDWTKTFASIGGNFQFLVAGVKRPTTNAGLINQDPRTAVAYNATHVFFIVVDGRRPGVSVGMSMDQLGDFCINQLGATHGINQDGGGSSAMWVDGTIVNVPSDGPERAVANGMLMVSLVDNSARSTAYLAGQMVRTTASASLRTGPGTNHHLIGSIASGQEGTVVAHSLNGTTAKQATWWKVQFAGGTGWVDASLLELVAANAANWDEYQ